MIDPFRAGFAADYDGRSLGVQVRLVALVVSTGGFDAAARACNRSGGFCDVPGGTRIAVYRATLLLGMLLLAAVDQRGSTSSSRA